MDALKRLSMAERLRELAWEGFTPEDIAQAASVPVDVVEGLYDKSAASHWAQQLVLRAWTRLMPPDVDEVAVERALDGDYAPELLTPPERREAVRQLVLSRRSNREIAEQIKATDRTVARIVAALGLNGHRPPSLLAEGAAEKLFAGSSRHMPMLDERDC